jgi:hypothetical protein
VIALPFNQPSQIRRILALIAFIVPNVALAHCLIPEESLLEVRCESKDQVLVVEARTFDTIAEPRACPSEVKVTHAEVGHYEGWERTYVGQEAIYRHLNPRELETIIGFGAQNSLTIWRPYSTPGSTVRGYIEFAGGPHWDLQCDVAR